MPRTARTSRVPTTIEEARQRLQVIDSEILDILQAFPDLRPVARRDTAARVRPARMAAATVRLARAVH